MRTTVDIDTPVLNEVKALQKKVGRSLGQVVTELLTLGLVQHKTPPKAPRFRWLSREMKATVDLADKDAVYALLDSE